MSIIQIHCYYPIDSKMEYRLFFFERHIRLLFAPPSIAHLTRVLLYGYIWIRSVYRSRAHAASFSRASERLFITQPAVSKRVAGLESELNAQLFNRIGRQITLTEAGKQLLPKARELLEQADELKRIASNLSDEVQGNLSIGYCASHRTSSDASNP